MEKFKGIFIYIVSFLIVFPPLATCLVYVINKRIHQHTWRAIHQAVQWTNIFYIISTMLLCYSLFERIFLSYIILLHIIILTILVVAQWKRQTNIEMKQCLKLLWRISFLLFMLSYIILSIYGI